MDPDPGQPTDLIQSVSRAFRILESVGKEPGGLNAKQIAHRCNLALPTAYHLIRTLCYECYLTRRPHGIYVIGYEISSRFRDLSQALRQPASARAVMQHLALATGHSVYLARISDGQVVLAEVLEAPRSPHLEDLVPGFSESAHATAVGKALLASMAPDSRLTYLRSQGLHALTQHTVIDKGRLEVELWTGKRTGFFTEQNQFRDDVSCAAVLVDGSTSLGLSSSSSRFRRFGRGLIRELQTAARDLTATS